MANVKETQDVLKFIIGLGMGFSKALEDGKLSLGDFKHFTSLVTSIPQAIKGISKVPAEIRDLDQAEREILIKYVKQEFDIPDDRVEALVEEGIDLAAQLYSFAKKL